MEDWRENAVSNKDRLKYALKQGILTDVAFSVGPERTLIYAHKTILSLASPVFETMFYGSLKETSQIIDIADLMPSIFNLLLDYIYTDDVKFSNETEAFSAWIAADKYSLPPMRYICFKYLMSECTITSDNVGVILENALLLKSQPLVNRCLSYLTCERPQMSTNRLAYALRPRQNAPKFYNRYSHDVPKACGHQNCHLSDNLQDYLSECSSSCDSICGVSSSEDDQDCEGVSREDFLVYTEDYDSSTNFLSS